jgi:hypothetical protein
MSSIALRQPRGPADRAIVTLFPRLLSTPVLPGALPLRRVLSLLAAALAAVLMLSVADAHAVVTEVGGTKVGLQPRNSASEIVANIVVNTKGEAKANPLPETFANNAGNPVLHSSNAYAVYWDPTNHYHGDWQHVINTYLQGAGASGGSLANVFAVDSQYTDTSNKPAAATSNFEGAYTDTHPYPGAGCVDPHPLLSSPLWGPKAITCLTDAQLQEELQGYIAQHGLPKGMGTIYYLLTPPGVTVCVTGSATHCSDFEGSEEEESYANSFCSYHSAINPGGLATGDANTILYAAIPWTAGGLANGRLAGPDQTEARYCQDGGFDPSSKPAGTYDGGPEQEPNQVECPSPDGYCDTGLADLIINQIAAEQQNIATNPLLNAWQDAAKNEATDECRNWFAPILGGGRARKPGSEAGTLNNQSLNGGPYYLNDAFNLAALRLEYPGVPCLTGVNLAPQFTAPNPVNSGETVAFDGMESHITLNAATSFSSGGSPQPNYATYTWNFGDGSPLVSGYAPGAPACETPWLSPCAASALHSYQYGGTYLVTLTVTDVGGHTASTSSTIIVNGPSPSSGASGGSSGAGGSSSASGTGGSGGSSTAGKTVPPPVAAAAVISHSLKSALRKGLVVRYSVNGQVAGRFEVLASRTLARQLGLTGATAVGLPKGTAPQVVIAKAILVTTAAGRSTFVIHFSKRTAARLARKHKVTLMLRLIVRNAASRNPATATVLSIFTLSR